MAMNRIQFQPGLSMPAFLKLYGTDAQCAVALEQARWPVGFHCPRCDGAAFTVCVLGVFVDAKKLCSFASWALCVCNWHGWGNSGRRVDFRTWAFASVPSRLVVKAWLVIPAMLLN
jgi:hypothetical protein